VVRASSSPLKVPRASPSTWRLLAAVVFLSGCAQAAAPGGQPQLPSYKDGREYFAPSNRGLVSRSQAAAGVTRYFLTNSRRVCYAFELPGTWQPGRESAVLRRVDDKGIVAVALLSVKDLGGGSPEAAIRKAAENSGKLYAAESRKVAWTLTPYERVPGAWQWTLPGDFPIGDGKGTVKRIVPRWYLPAGDGWIAQFALGVPSDVDRDAFVSGVLQSLTTSREPRCYETRLRELGEVR